MAGLLKACLCGCLRRLCCGKEKADDRGTENEYKPVSSGGDGWDDDWGDDVEGGATGTAGDSTTDDDSVSHQPPAAQPFAANLPRPGSFRGQQVGSKPLPVAKNEVDMFACLGMDMNPSQVKTSKRLDKATRMKVKQAARQQEAAAPVDTRNISSRLKFEVDDSSGNSWGDEDLNLGPTREVKKKAPRSIGAQRM